MASKTTRQTRRAEGLCVDCGAQAEGLTRCADCRAKAADAKRRREFLRRLTALRAYVDAAGTALKRLQDEHEALCVLAGNVKPTEK